LELFPARVSRYCPRFEAIMGEKALEIICPVCGRDTLLVRRPRYEGFTKTGETLTCASCGHEFADEAEIPFKHQPKVRVFTDADRPPDVKVFEQHEADALCRHCRHYVVNPFLQRCGLHRREVEATDTCPQFQRKPETPPKPLL